MSRASASARKRGTPRSPAGGVLSPRRGRSASRRASANAGTVRLFLVFFALIGVNVYFLGIRGGTSIGELMRITRVHAGAGAPEATAADRKPIVKAAPLIDDPAGGRTFELQLGDGQTIAQVLTPCLGKKLAATVEEGLAEVMDLASVRTGQVLSVVQDAEDRVVAVEFRVSPILAHRLELSGKQPRASKVEGRLDSRIIEVVVPCGAGLWDGLKRSGENAALGELIGRVLGGEGDLAACAPGERLRVIAEKRLVGGRFQRYGRILGAEWVTRAGIRRSFAYGAVDPAYYNERGEATARRYLASPLRLSRGGGQVKAAPRTERDGRVSIEYGAPPASVVQAVATGVVTAITRGSIGNSVTLVVAGSSERVEYTHVTHLARGIKLGVALQQGHALGRCDAGVTVTYEGAGAAAQLGRAVAPRGEALPASERPRFGESIAPILERLRALTLREPQGLAARPLSAIP